MTKTTNIDALMAKTHPITNDAISTLLLEATYDIYGMLRREYGDDMSFDRYAEDIMTEGSLKCLTPEQLKIGYDIISDLWEFNEQDGHNAPDGKYRRYPAIARLIKVEDTSATDEAIVEYYWVYAANKYSYQAYVDYLDENHMQVVKVLTDACVLQCDIELDDSGIFVAPVKL